MSPRHDHDSTLTVFLSRGRLSHGIRQTLEDFTATGLVRDLVWVDADTFQTSSSQVTHLRIREDGIPEIARQPFNVLVAHSGADRLHLGVINAVGPGGSQLGSTELSPLLGAIDALGSGLSTHRTNLVISAVGAPLEGDLPLLRGYTNLLLAPEDSPGPEAAPVPFHFNQLDNRFTLHCVAGIASIFGLWEGSTTAPVTRLEPASGLTFRLVRAFYRRIDGQEVQARLKSRILDTTDNPLPRLLEAGQEDSAQYTENPESFAAGAARELLAEFDRHLTGTREEAVSQRTRVTSAGGAIGEFFRTFCTKLVTTPHRFFADLRAESSALVGDTVQSAVYGGSGSRTHVGGSAGAGDDTDFASAFGTAGQQDYEAHAAAELGPLWQAYEHTALTLLDAHPRVISANGGSARRPQVVENGPGGHVQVARRSSDVIPGPDHNFGGDLPVEVKATVGGGDVAPYDVDGVAAYERLLAGQGHHGQGRHRDIGRVRGDFGQWQKRHSTSFAYFVGRGLVDKRAALRSDEQHYARQVDDLKNQQAKAEGSGIAGAVFRWLGWVAFWSVTLFAALWGIGNLRTDDAGVPLWQWVRHLNDSTGETKAWLFGIWLGLWLLFWISQVICETRNELRFLHRRRDIVSRYEAARKNLAATRRALVRLDVGYRQFLSVSRIVGTLIERPFGKVGHLRVESTIPVNTMPDSVLFAEAAPQDAAVDRLADSFRRDIYREGWLDSYVSAGLKEAAADLTGQEHGHVDVRRVHTTHGEGTGGQLARLATWITGEKFRSRDRSGTQWRDITERLRTEDYLDDADVLTPLQTYRAGRRHTAPQQLPLDEGVAVGSFNGEIATERGRVDGVLDLDPAFCTYDRNTNTFDAIGVSEVLVQVGESATQSDVAFGGPQRERLSADILGNMPVDEDSRPQSPGIEPMSPPQPRRQLPGMGEF